MTNTDQLPTSAFATQQDWDAWLAAHHTDAAGLWLKIAKKDSGIPSVTYAEALDCALCYGWIDGQKAALDAIFWLQKFTPRRTKSKWSQVNCQKATDLSAAGRMQPEGLRQIAAAQADGRWAAAYASHSTATVPDDLQHALDQCPAAQAFFSTLNSQNRYAILYRIQTAVKPETRAARIQKFIEMLAKGEKLYP